MHDYPTPALIFLRLLKIFQISNYVLLSLQNWAQEKSLNNIYSNQFCWKESLYYSNICPGNHTLGLISNQKAVSFTTSLFYEILKVNSLGVGFLLTWENYLRISLESHLRIHLNREFNANYLQGVWKPFWDNYHINQVFKI